MNDAAALFHDVALSSGARDSRNETVQKDANIIALYHRWFLVLHL